MEQLRLFPETIEERCLRECKETKASLDRVRKGQFAKIGEQTRIINEVKNDLEILKKGICETSIFDRRSFELYREEMILLRQDADNLRLEIEALKEKFNCEYLQLALH